MPRSTPWRCKPAAVCTRCVCCPSAYVVVLLLQAGLEIIAALPKLNRELESKGLRLAKPLRIRLGMHSGSVVIGAMGGGNRTET